MSAILYLASDGPLAERVNPHVKALSVNEALKMGVEDIPAFMLEDGFDRDKPDVLLWSDIEISLDTTEKGFDDDFAIWLREKVVDMQTEKKNCAYLEWDWYTPGRAAQLIEYLKVQMQNTSQLELWYAWWDGSLGHRIKKVAIPVDSLTPEDIGELVQQKFWEEPLTDYCFVITR